VKQTLMGFHHGILLLKLVGCLVKRHCILSLYRIALCCQISRLLAAPFFLGGFPLFEMLDVQGSFLDHLFLDGLDHFHVNSLAADLLL